MTDTFRYHASCHCREIRIDFQAEERLEDRTFISCNCSICTKNGYINYYIPQSKLNFHSGSLDTMSEYSFEPHNRKHKFCKNCGTSMFIVSNEKIPDNGKIGINMRAVENLDVEKLHVVAVDGRAREPEDEMRKWEEEKAQRT